MNTKKCECIEFIVDESNFIPSHIVDLETGQIKDDGLMLKCGNCNHPHSEEKCNVIMFMGTDAEMQETQQSFFQEIAKNAKEYDNLGKF